MRVKIGVERDVKLELFLQLVTAFSDHLPGHFSGLRYFWLNFNGVLKDVPLLVFDLELVIVRHQLALFCMVLHCYAMRCNVMQWGAMGCNGILGPCFYKIIFHISHHFHNFVSFLGFVLFLFCRDFMFCF